MRKFVGRLCMSLFMPFQLLCGLAMAQVPQPVANPTQVSTAGNYGRLTIYQGAVGTGNYTQFGTRLLGDCSMAVQASFPGVCTTDADCAATGGYVLDNIVWTAVGQDGPGACSGRGCVPPTYLTYMPEINPADGSTINTPLVYLMTAAPDVDPTDGVSPVYVQGYCGAQPCTLASWHDVSPATLADGTPATFVHQGVPCRVWGTCDEWALNGHLQASNSDGTTILYLLHVTGAGCSGRGCGLAVGGQFFLTVGVTQHYVSPPPPPPPPSDDGVAPSLRAQHAHSGHM